MMRYFALIMWLALISYSAITNHSYAKTEALKEEESSVPNIDLQFQNFTMLLYHHVDDNTPSITSVSPKTFLEHMEYLNEHHEVISLERALESIKSHEPLPNKSVVITFDDGYTNILENAHPILRDFEFPYTVFINPESINAYGSQLTWEQVRSMQPLATFANHTLDHLHLLERLEDESESEWLERVTHNIDKAEAKLEEELDYSKKWIAYPFGEFNTRLKTHLFDKGYIGFGQQSGAVRRFSDFAALPRFPAAGIYANLDSLKVKLSSIAMPVANVFPSQVEFKAGDSIDTLSFDAHAEDFTPASLNCFFKSTAVPIKHSQTSGQNVRFELKLNHNFTPGRTRVNCTAPSKSLKGRFYWHSFPMFVATNEGEFLD